jgi:hypothetical protein
MFVLPRALNSIQQCGRFWDWRRAEFQLTGSFAGINRQVAYVGAMDRSVVCTENLNPRPGRPATATEASRDFKFCGVVCTENSIRDGRRSHCGNWIVPGRQRRLRRNAPRLDAQYLAMEVGRSPIAPVLPIAMIRDFGTSRS